VDTKDLTSFECFSVLRLWLWASLRLNVRGKVYNACTHTWPQLVLGWIVLQSTHASFQSQN